MSLMAALYPIGGVQVSKVQCHRNSSAYQLGHSFAAAVSSFLRLVIVAFYACTKIVYDNYMRCAIYARVSTTDQNCEVQLCELRQYISHRAWKNCGEYVDTGFSGIRANRPALERLMADAAQRKFDCIAVYKIDRFGRSVLHLNQQLATLNCYGVRFIATSQSLETDERNPTSRLLLQVLASVAEFEREMIRERTLSGIKAAQAAGKIVGRPKKVFPRDEVMRLRDEEGLSWRAIGRKLSIPAMTALDSYRNGCTGAIPLSPPFAVGV
jgi:putative DNA-invertase from lambdoid prophage Rac